MTTLLFLNLSDVFNGTKITVIHSPVLKFEFTKPEGGVVGGGVRGSTDD